jgi:hypothetical protein
VPQAKPVYMLSPVGLLDRGDPRITRHTGQLVQKVQPAGTPRNGLMAMCFLQLADTGQFIGQVCESSLIPTGEKQVPRDRAQEVRERRSIVRRSSVHARRTGTP